MTAAILALAVEEAGGKVEGLYDGSWAEWGSRAVSGRHRAGVRRGGSGRLAEIYNPAREPLADKSL